MMQNSIDETTTPRCMHKLHEHLDQKSCNRGKTIQMIISSEFTEKNESDYHDRFIISQERVWNFASAYQIYGNQIVDIQKLEDQETIDNDLKMFEKLWNGKILWVFIQSTFIYILFKEFSVSLLFPLI